MTVAPRILYVDDDPENCAFMSFWLKRDYGYDVVLAMDGKRAKQIIEQEFFDLYLLDYCLPDATATTLCHDIRSVNPAAPIIVYSALDRDVDRLLAINAGANSYFIKPDQMDLVGQEIERLFGGSSGAWHQSNPQTEIEMWSHVPGHGHNRKRSSGIV